MIFSVGIVASSDLFYVNISLAEELKRRFNSRVFLYVDTKASKKKFSKYVVQGIFDDVIVCNVLHREARRTDLNKNEVTDLGNRLEQELSFSFNELIMSRRDFGHGFATGGPYHPHNFYSKNSDYYQTIHGFSSQLLFWKKELQTKDLEIILNGPKETAIVCRALSRKYFQLVSARHENYWIWSPNEYGENSTIKHCFDATYEFDESVQSKKNSYFTDMHQRKIFFDNNSLLGMIKKSYIFLKASLFKRIAGGENWKNSYNVGSMLGFYIRELKYTKQLLSEKYTVSLEKMAGTPFVYFPLATEPETTLQVMSPECTNQLALIASIARDLPVGVFLAVKETIYGVGRRPNDFYDQIRSFKNVVILPINEPGIDVVKKAEVIATINGTAGLEGILFGKPVIVFGRHVDYSFLPQAFLVQREEELALNLKLALKAKAESENFAKLGARYLKALEKSSFVFGQFSAVQAQSYDNEAIRKMVDALEQLTIEKDKK